MTDNTVTLTPYDPNWPLIYQQEATAIQQALGANCQLIEHVGSTSIPGMTAKPIIDILVAVADLGIIDANPDCLQPLGYTNKGEYGTPGRRFFWKTPEQRHFNLHLFAIGDPQIDRRLAFRDYLRNHPAVAAGYAAIKVELAKQFPNAPMGYHDAKDSFIRAIDYHTGNAREDQLNAKDDVILLPYDPRWPQLAAAEIAAIKHTVDLPYESIQHLGSTAIPSMIAKPILDIFVGVKDMGTAGEWIKPLQNLGYIDWPENPDKMHARFFKGMPPFGIARTHHLHILPTGDDLNRRIQFRDSLRQSPQLCQQYAGLKQQLAAEHPNDRERYTEAKAAFIQSALD